MTKQMKCRYCGKSIVWREGLGWLVTDEDHSFGIYGSSTCGSRPTAHGGPEDGHRLTSENLEATVEVASRHSLEGLEVARDAPRDHQVVGWCACHSPNGNNEGRADWSGATVEEVVDQWMEHFMDEVNSVE